ncbi:MAG TPA: hypothetical protein VFU11_02080 [Solirubrobacterales bacterium]|nr:hypothetical protein [Solirubrobacterales bacterium]
MVVVKGDASTLYAYAYFSAPVTAEVVIPIEVHKVARGGFGTESIASFPKIAGGSGAVTYFKLSFKRGVLRATCSGRQIHARIAAAFRDGTKASAALASPCTSKDAGTRGR